MYAGTCIHFGLRWPWSAVLSFSGSSAGDGHFSPLGGYHEARDLVLILDTARFKYAPHWVRPAANMHYGLTEHTPSPNRIPHAASHTREHGATHFWLRHAAQLFSRTVVQLCMSFCFLIPLTA